MCHGQEVPRDLNRKFERHGTVLANAAYESLADAQLPNHCSKPLLCYADLDGLSFGALEVRWYCLGELSLQLRDPRRVCVTVDSVPEVDKCVVNGFVQIDHQLKTDCDWSI